MQPATTVAGLAVWAKAARFDIRGLDIDTPIADLDDWPKEVAAQFFDVVEQLAGVSTNLNEAMQPSPVMASFKEWTEQRDAANEYGAVKDHDEDRLATLCETANATMTRLLGLPAADIRDLAAKLIAATDHGAYPDLAGFNESMSLIREAAAIVGRVEHLENL